MTDINDKMLAIEGILSQAYNDQLQEIWDRRAEMAPGEVDKVMEEVADGFSRIGRQQFVKARRVAREWNLVRD